MALCARNAHITVYDVTTWSWVNLVHPPSYILFAVPCACTCELRAAKALLLVSVWRVPYACQPVDIASKRGP